MYLSVLLLPLLLFPMLTFLFIYEDGYDNKSLWIELVQGDFRWQLSSVEQHLVVIKISSYQSCCGAEDRVTFQKRLLTLVFLWSAPSACRQDSRPWAGTWLSEVGSDPDAQGREATTCVVFPGNQESARRGAGPARHRRAAAVSGEQCRPLRILVCSNLRHRRVPRLKPVSPRHYSPVRDTYSLTWPQATISVTSRRGGRWERTTKRKQWPSRWLTPEWRGAQPHVPRPSPGPCCWVWCRPPGSRWAVSWCTRWTCWKKSTFWLLCVRWCLLLFCSPLCDSSWLSSSQELHGPAAAFTGITEMPQSPDPVIRM